MASNRKFEAEDPKGFFQQVMQRGPYYGVLRLLEANPDLSVNGRVYHSNSHYVHEKSTTVELTLEGYNADETSPGDKDYDLVTALQEDLAEKVVDWNRQLSRDLYAELEYQQSDKSLIDFFNANDWRWDEDGEQVDMTDYMPVTLLQPGIQEKVLKEYADLFERTPQQVLTALMQRDYRFDKRGNRIDVSQFKPINELEPETRKRILDKHRTFLVDGDDSWAEDTQEMWKEKLEGLGFQRVKISYSLGYGQGDGASFTSDSIDVPALCRAIPKMERTEAAARELVTSILA